MGRRVGMNKIVMKLCAGLIKASVNGKVSRSECLKTFFVHVKGVGLVEITIKEKERDFLLIKTE